MRLTLATRVLMVVGLGALVACGLDVLATRDAPVSGPDATTPNLPDRDAAPPSDGSSGDVVDGGPDANPNKCLAGCTNGTCDAGWCVLDCAAPGACKGKKDAVCPPGIPCEVHCGAGSCTQGVDCTAASACRIDCAGAGSCINQPVNCTGLSCSVACAGAGSCTQGVSCDAGACTIDCLGDGTCRNAPTTCTGSTCTVRCGNGASGDDACNQGVTCETTQLCDIGCLSRNTCRNQPNSARSGGTSIVQCTGQDSCNKGSELSGGEAGVLCGGASGACKSTSFCDAGKCSATCSGGDDFTFCCKSAGACNLTNNGCQVDMAGCP